MTTEENTTHDPDPRPLGSWPRIVDALLAREYTAGFAGEEASRRDWMLLSVLSGDVDAPGLAERIARKGKRLRGLADRGWAAEQADGTWALTDAGRAARDRLGGVADGIRSRVTDAVSPEDLATTVASLEAIARALGWDDGMPEPRRTFGRGRGFGGPFPVASDYRDGIGRNRHRGFPSPWGPGHGPNGHGGGAHDEHDDHDHGHEHGHGEHPHGHDDHRGHPHGHDCGARGRHGHRYDGLPHAHGRGHGRRRAERAYERGFEAGFVRGCQARGD